MLDSGDKEMDARSFDVEFHSEQVVSQGFTIIPNAVTAERAREAINALEEIYERERPIAERMGEQTENQKVARNPIAKHPFFETFYLCPPVLSVCKRILGTTWCSTTQLGARFGRAEVGRRGTDSKYTSTASYSAFCRSWEELTSRSVSTYSGRW